MVGKRRGLHEITSVPLGLTLPELATRTRPPSYLKFSLGTDYDAGGYTSNRVRLC